MPVELRLKALKLLRKLDEQVGPLVPTVRQFEIGDVELIDLLDKWCDFVIYNLDEKQTAIMDRLYKIVYRHQRDEDIREKRAA